MRTLVVALNYNNNGYYEFPLGLAYVSGSLKEAGLPVRCLNLNHYYEPLELLLKEAIIGHDIDILLTGGLSPFYGSVHEIITTARKIKPDLITVAGGGLVSSEPEIVVRGLGCDYGVIGEGEVTIVELVQALEAGRDVRTLPGVCYVDRSDTFIITPPRNAIADLDAIPYPDYDGLEIKTYLDRQLPNDNYYLYTNDRPRSFPLISSRSCPLKCTFCYHPIGQTYRKRSLDNVFGEIDRIIEKYDINTLALFDELFSDNKKRLQEFCERLKPYGLRWIAQLRVPSIDDDTISLMKESGCMNVSYGLESASPAVLKSMEKKVTVGQIEKAMRLSYDANIGIQGNFIFLDQAETVSTAVTTLRWWQENIRYQINLGVIGFYPGTPLWKQATESGIISDKLLSITRGAAETVNMTTMSDTEVEELIWVIDLLTEHYTMGMPIPTVGRIERDGFGPDRQPLSAMELTCPECGVTTHYGRLSDSGVKWFNAIHIIGCRSCNQRLLLPLDNNHAYLQRRVKEIIATVAERGIALLIDRPGNEGIVKTRKLMALTDFGGGRLSALYGRNPFDQNLSIDGVPLYDADTRLGRMKETALVISSCEEARLREVDLLRLASTGVQIFSLYDKEIRPYAGRENDKGAAPFASLDRPVRVAIFGTGLAAERLGAMVAEAGWAVPFYCDNNQQKWGASFANKEVRDPSRLSEGGFDLIAVASAPGKKAIFAQLEGMRFTYGRDYLYFEDPFFSSLNERKRIRAIAASEFSTLFGVER